MTRNRCTISLGVDSGSWKVSKNCITLRSAPTSNSSIASAGSNEGGCLTIDTRSFFRCATSAPASRSGALQTAASSGLFGCPTRRLYVWDLSGVAPFVFKGVAFDSYFTGGVYGGACGRVQFTNCTRLGSELPHEPKARMASLHRYFHS